MPLGESRQAAVHSQERRQSRPLSLLHGVGGFLVLVVWLALFGAGIMVDTTPYRKAISADAEEKLRVEGEPATTDATALQAPAALPVADATSARPPAHVPGMLESWLVVFFCFLPLNLAWLCVSASTLGTVGNLANLSDDRDTQQPRDKSNPLLSAILRGFFVYLFLMSGLLLLDHAPFSNAGPNQYIRLAGFLSLFSFVVSYHPHLFGTLIVSAFERLQVRAGDRNGGGSTIVQEHTSVKSVEIESTTAASVATDTMQPGRQ